MIERHDAAAKSIVDAMLGCDVFGPFVGFVDAGPTGIVCAAILHTFTAHDVHLTVAGKRVTVAMARHMAAECFGFCGRSRVTAITRESNRAAIRCLARFGFTFEGRLDAYYGDEAGSIFGLYASSQRLTG